MFCNKKIVVLVMVFAAGFANADPVIDSGHGTVTFTGSIIAAPCSIEFDTQTQTVNLGQISNQVLVGGGGTTVQLFKINLNECSVAVDGGVKITFSGTPAGSNPDHFAIASNKTLAGLSIVGVSGDAIKPGVTTALSKISGRDHTLDFGVQLVGKDGLDEKDVVTGEFSTTLNWSLVYE